MNILNYVYTEAKRKEYKPVCHLAFNNFATHWDRSYVSTHFSNGVKDTVICTDSIEKPSFRFSLKQMPKLAIKFNSTKHKFIPILYNISNRIPAWILWLSNLHGCPLEKPKDILMPMLLTFFNCVRFNNTTGTVCIFCSVCRSTASTRREE